MPLWTRRRAPDDRGHPPRVQQVHEEQRHQRGLADGNEQADRRMKRAEMEEGKADRQGGERNQAGEDAVSLAGPCFEQAYAGRNGATRKAPRLLVR